MAAAAISTYIRTLDNRRKQGMAYTHLTDSVRDVETYKAISGKSSIVAAKRTYLILLSGAFGLLLLYHLESPKRHASQAGCITVNIITCCYIGGQMLQR